MKAQVSVCIIAKNEPLLEQACKSIRDFVEEIVIVDTGSTDNTPDVAKKYADIFEVYRDCNNPETGFIQDFSMARNRAFSLATQPWVMWMDADDIIAGAQNIAVLTNLHKPEQYGVESVCIMFPYEYAYNDKGECICIHYRERLVSNKNHYQWLNPVHEVLVVRPGFKSQMLSSDDVVFKHQRQYSQKITEPFRNLKILQKYIENNKEDARQHYYLGLEYAGANMLDKAYDVLKQYISMSGWDDEKCMACLKMVDICYQKADYDDGLRWAFLAVETKENWGEGYFALAKMFYHIANRGGPLENRYWQKCVFFANLGLSLPPTKTLLFVNPQERDFIIHQYLNVAYGKLGDIKAALSSASAGLAKNPDDKNLAYNKQLYEKILYRNETIQSLNNLLNSGDIDKDSYDLFIAIINKEVAPKRDTTTTTHANPILNDNQIAAAITSTNPNTWTIPNVCNHEEYPVEISKEQMQSMVIALWKQYILNDEVLAAEKFLENVPNSIKHTIDTDKAVQITKNIITQPRTDIETNTVQEDRVLLILNGLKDAKSVISLEDRFANRYNLAGYQIVKNDADCIVSTEAYDFSKDPIQNIFIPARENLKKDGKFLLTTYYTLTAKQKENWLSFRGLTTNTTWSVANHFRKARYWVKNSYVSDKNIFSEAYINGPQTNQPLDIVFFIGDGLEPWTPISVKKNGIGGSETAAIEMCKRLALMGHKVRMYVGCGEHGEGIYDGVEYYHSHKFKDLNCDVLVVSRMANMLDDSYNITAKLKLLWCHDMVAANGRHIWLLKAGRILALSNWHKQNLIEQHNLHEKHIVVTRNGIDLTRFNKTVSRNKYKVVNSSSPDRSWPVLLECWPEIKKQVPEAELHLFYGFKNWKVLAQHHPGQAELIQSIEAQIASLQGQGVIFRDRVSQEVLAEEFLSAGVIAYSTHFHETSCITMMEAQAAGLRMVTSNLAALKETVAERGVLIDGVWTSPEYKQEFIKNVVAALRKEDDSDRAKLQQYAKENFGWDSLAFDWEKMFIDLIGEVAKHPVVPYKPVPEYDVGE